MREQENHNSQQWTPEAEQNFVGFLQLLLELDEKQKRAKDKSLSHNQKQQ